MWKVSKDQDSIILDIINGSDRVTAIVGCAFIEELLRERLKTKFAHDKKAFDNVFGQNGPLGSLGAQCRFAYTAQIISRQTKDKIDHIGRIRNKFAHKSKDLRFDHAELKELMRELGKPRAYMLSPEGKTKGGYMIDGLSPRDHFIANLQDIVSFLDWEGERKSTRSLLVTSSPNKSPSRPASRTQKRG